MAEQTRPGISSLRALKHLDPKEYVRQVKAAMKKHNGGIPEAANELGISGRQLARWLDEKELASVERAPSGLRRDHKPVKK